MRIFLLLFVCISVFGCVATKSDITSVEAEDLGPIVNEASTKMLDCINYSDTKACNRAELLFEKHPWLITRKIDITNSNGMRQNEWDISVHLIRKGFNTIKNNYTEFTNVTK